MGCHTEPPFVHIVHVMQKLHFFQLFNFFKLVYTSYRRKKKLHTFTAQKIIQLFFIIYTTYCEKLYNLPLKRIHGLMFFLYTSYIFHV